MIPTHASRDSSPLYSLSPNPSHEHPKEILHKRNDHRAKIQRTSYGLFLIFEIKTKQIYIYSTFVTSSKALCNMALGGIRRLT